MLRLVLSTCLLIVSLADAAPVAWTPPSTIAGDTDVSAAGATVFAYNWESAAQTVNGVPFTPPGGGVTLGWSGGGTYGAFSNRSRHGDASLWTEHALQDHPRRWPLRCGRNPLHRHAQQSRSRPPIPSPNLAHRRAHLRPGPRGTLTSTGGNSVTLDYNYADTSNADGGVGQYSIGTFTADATTQSFTITGVAGTGNGAGASAQLNALQLRDVTAAAPSAPAITSQPQSQSVALGSTVTLGVTATGTEPLSYQWSWNGTADRRSHRRHPRAI